jgi:hypothetical protein
MPPPADNQSLQKEAVGLVFGGTGGRTRGNATSYVFNAAAGGLPEITTTTLSRMWCPAAVPGCAAAPKRRGRGVRALAAGAGYLPSTFSFSASLA